MTTTYSVDADITTSDPFAVSMRPATDSDFDRLRVLAYDEINRALVRRRPSIDAPGDLTDRSQLTWCEVCGALAYLYSDAVARTGDDVLKWRYDLWSGRFRAEVQNVEPDIVGEGVSTSGNTIPIYRTG